MSYVSILQRLPPDLQLPMVEVVEALRKDLRQELAVRREDFIELRKTVQELAEAQKRMMEAIVSLAQRMDAVEKQRAVAQEKGYSLFQEPVAIDVDGEMDMVAPIETPSGERLWVIIEVKGRPRRKEVGQFLQRLQQPQVVQQLEAMGVEKPYLPSVFGMRVYFGVDEMARETGVGILTFRGERVPARVWG